MKNKFSVALAFVLIFSAIMCSGCFLDGRKLGTVYFFAIGDDVSVGYGPKGTSIRSYYDDYISQNESINNKCFTKILANSISYKWDSEIKMAAQYGAKSDEILKDLDNEDSATIINDSTAITLCMGLNNIKRPIFENFYDYITNVKSDDDMEQLFENEVTNFISDYDKIISKIAVGSKKVYSMTIYNPYRYFNVNEIKLTSYQNTGRVYLNKFSNLITMGMSYLDEINEHIKDSHSDNVIIVDVRSEFERIPKSLYSQYVNVDSSKIVINSQEEITRIEENMYIDPCPTILGQEYLSRMFEEEFNKTY